MFPLIPGCTNWCSGHGKCKCDSPDDLVLLSHRVKLFDANGFAEPDQIITERLPRSTALASGSAGAHCRCSCRPGFAPPFCSQAVTERGCPNSCSGQGSCGPLRGGARCPGGRDCCTCNPDFMGDDCGTVRPTCPDNCSGHGTCLHGTCSCNVGFGGESCNDAVGAPDPPASPPSPPRPPPGRPPRTSGASSPAKATSLLQLGEVSFLSTVPSLLQLGEEESNRPSTDLAHEASSMLRSLMTRLTSHSMLAIPAEDGSGECTAPHLFAPRVLRSFRPSPRPSFRKL